ncbi:hypothetical protein, partial [Campylobacter fetus]
NVDGGAGNDELVINSTTAAVLQPTVVNIEKVTVNNTAGTLTLSMTNASGVNEIDIKSDAGATNIASSTASVLNFLSTAEGTNAVTI